MSSLPRALFFLFLLAFALLSGASGRRVLIPPEEGGEGRSLKVEMNDYRDPEPEPTPSDPPHGEIPHDSGEEIEERSLNVSVDDVNSPLKLEFHW